MAQKFVKGVTYKVGQKTIRVIRPYEMNGREYGEAVVTEPGKPQTIQHLVPSDIEGAEVVSP